MTKKGEVEYFNGNTGSIKGEDGIDYILLKNEIKKYINKDSDIYNINVGDKVSFIPDIYETPEIREYIARFIKKDIDPTIYNNDDSIKYKK